MTHTSTEQPEALRVAAWLITAPQSTTIGDMLIAGRELRRLHARVQELEAQTAHMADLVELADYATKKLEAAQAQRTPLSDEQIDGINRFITATVFGRIARGRAIARAVEAAHGITQEKQG